MFLVSTNEEHVGSISLHIQPMTAENMPGRECEAGESPKVDKNTIIQKKGKLVLMSAWSWPDANSHHLP